MTTLQSVGDRFAISLSFLCAVHCLLFPAALTVLPSALAVTLGGEAFHVWLVFLVIPLSGFALIAGCRVHKQLRWLLVGCVGLLLLTAAAIFGETLGHEFEEVATLLASAIIAFSHFKNFRHCQRARTPCGCGETHATA